MARRKLEITKNSREADVAGLILHLFMQVGGSAKFPVPGLDPGFQRIEICTRVVKAHSYDSKDALHVLNAFDRIGVEKWLRNFSGLG